MNKSELVEAAAKEAGLTQIDTALALNAIMDTIIKTVAKREEITLVGFGSFKSYERAARTGQNPRTREPIEIPAAVLPKFSPGSKFKDAVLEANPIKKSNKKKK